MFDGSGTRQYVACRTLLERVNPTQDRRLHATIGAVAFLLVLGILPVTQAREHFAADTNTADFLVDAGQPGPTMNVDFIGNATRLDTLLGLPTAASLASAQRKARSGSNAEFFQTRYPHYRQFRIGNVFVGYECTDLDFDELAVRGSDGRLQYRFGQTLDMLQMMLTAGIKPHLALTGTPLALVPPGEAVLRHPNYGCVNAPPIDLSKVEPRDRMRDWWQLQDAFLTALEERFGKAEVKSWTFATWTEPMNPGRKLDHLVMPEKIVQAGRHDEAVATLLAASIDVAMKHEVHIRIGNLAGRVQTEYPKLMAEIAKFPRGGAYLDYIDGYAISRYRTQAGADIGHQLDVAFKLLDNGAMPAKPLYIDELGDLAGNDGTKPFHAASGLEGARFMASALERVYKRQDGSPRVPRSVAFWRDQIEPRARNLFSQPEAYLKTPASHVTNMFASMNGYSRLLAQGPQHQIIAGQRDGQIKAILLPSASRTGMATTLQTRNLAVRGLPPMVEYEVTLTEVNRQKGNPISAFLGGSESYLQDSEGRFKSAGGKWSLATSHWETCYYDEDAACAWRQKAREIELPLRRKLKIRTDAGGVLNTSNVIDPAGVLMVDMTPVL